MLLITNEVIKKLKITPKECYFWVENMLKNKNNQLLPLKISLKPYEGCFCNVMPSMIKNDFGYYGGIKIVTRYTNREPSLDSKLLLFDGTSGEFLAFMDANWITTMRTGAVAAHSINLLAKKDYSTIGIIGLGNVSRATLLVLREIDPNRKVNIKLYKYKKQEESFISRFKNLKNVTFSLVDTYEELVKGSDVVISGVTYAKNDFCNDDCFDEGVLVVPIHTLGFTNCDLFFDKVYGDDIEHIKDFKNFSKFKNFSEISSVISNKKPGRENNKERILVYNVGISIHDVNFASHIYNLVVDNKNNENDILDFGSPNCKYWI